MRGGDEADAAKAAAARVYLGLEHPLHRRPERQVGIADDAGADLGPSVCPGGAHRRHAVGELDLADRPELSWTRGAVHREPFEIDGRGDVVSRSNVGEQLGQQVAAGLGPLDQMMMGVDDRQTGLDDLFASAVEPVLANCKVRADRGCRWCGLHRLDSSPIQRPLFPPHRRRPVPMANMGPGLRRPGWQEAWARHLPW